MKNLKIVILSQLLILTSLLAPGLTNTVHASATGVVCLAAGGSTTCPVSPPVLRPGPGAIQLRVAVVISNSTSLNTFDITLLTNHTILKPAGVSLSGTILGTSPSTLVECIGGVALVSTCASTDNVNTLHFSASGVALTVQPATGLLFTAIYNITGASATTPIAFQTGCLNTSSGSTCANIGQGTTTPVPESTQSATFSNAPGFTVSAAPSSISLFTGQAATSLVTVTSLGGFSGTVSMSVTLALGGPSLHLDLTSLRLTANGSNSTTLHINTAGVATGTYMVTVRGASGSTSGSAPITVNVFLPSFRIFANPNALSIIQGSNASSLVTVTSNGFTGTVSLTASVSPTGPSSFLSTSSLTVVAGGQNSTFVGIIVGSTVAAGSYNVTVLGTSGALMASAVLSVNVRSPTSGGDFTFTPSSTSISIGQGDRGDITINATSLNGFSGTIFITGFFSGNPPGGTEGGFSTQIFLTSGGTQTTGLFFTIPYNATISNFNFTMTGSSSNGLISHSFTLQVTVFAQPAFRITSRDLTVLVPTGFSNSTVIQVDTNALFVGTIALSTTIGPPGPTANLNASSITLGKNQKGNVDLTIAAGPTIAAGLYFLTITGESGHMIQSVFVVIRVVFVSPPPTPNFTITATPKLVQVQPGFNASFTITVRSLDSFGGMVNLTTIVAPNGFNAPTGSIPSRIVLPPNGTVNVTMFVTTSNTTPFGFWTITASGTGGVIHSFDSVTLQVIPPPDETPVAAFTFTPSSPIAGETVSFDGSLSSDADGAVQQWMWNFGDGSFITTSGSPIIFHTFFNPGVYTVTLTVRDSAGLFGTPTSMTVTVSPKPLHDVSITNINVFPLKAVSTQQVSVSLTIENNGLSNETVTVTVLANGHPVQTETGLFVQGCGSNVGFCYPYTYTTVSWDTTGVLAGNYTISATVSLPNGEVDPSPSDNTASDGTVMILPAPTVTVTPASGPVGTKVLVTGSGFPAQFSPYGPSVNYILVTFDDMTLGFKLTSTGSFNLTIDVPQAQPGTHLVKALDEFTLARAVAAFTVTPTAGTLAVSIDTGPLYFPGDSVVIYIQTTFNGAPVGPSGVQLHLVLFKADGTNSTLAATPIGTGIYKATYALTSSATLGTYAVQASAHETGPLDASALRSFEVKPTWLSQNGKSLVAGATVAGLVGLVALAWKQGYLPRRKGEPSIPSF